MNASGSSTGMFFILSAGRSGSRSISHMLDTYPGCICLHHPEPELIIECSEWFYGDYPTSGIGEQLTATRPPVACNGVYGEANLQLSLIIPVLCDQFPHSKFIWLIRDGRDVVASMFDRGWYDPGSKRVAAVWHNARLQGNRCGDFSTAEWNGLTRFEKCCWLWSKYNRIIEEAFSVLPRHRRMMVRLDRLRASQKELADFLALKMDQVAPVDRLNVALQPVTYWKSWSWKSRRQFEKHCSGVMDQWFPEWRDGDGKWQVIEHERPDRVEVPRYLNRPGTAVRLRRAVAKMRTVLRTAVRNRQ